MNTFDWKKLLPAGAAIVLFYLLSLAYFSPVLEGKRLVQGDKRNWQGMAQEVIEHRDAYGDEPLWTGSMFSGMPAYQVSVQWSANLLQYVDRLFHRSHAVFVGGAVNDSAFHSASCKPGTKGPGMMLATFGVGRVVKGGATEFRCPDYKGFIQQTAVLQVLNESGNWLIDVLGEAHVGHHIAVCIPVPR